MPNIDMSQKLTPPAPQIKSETTEIDFNPPEVAKNCHDYQNEESKPQQRLPKA